MDTILNIDLDFMTQPYYVGDHYVVQEWESYSDFKSVAKNWITPSEILEKVGIKEKIKGEFVQSDKQALFSWEGVRVSNRVEFPCRILNFDAHMDMYATNADGEYYDDFSLGSFYDYDCLIAPFLYGWCDRIDWIYPDYFNIEDLERQFNFIKPVDFKDGVYTLYVSELFEVKVKPIKYSDFDLSEYNIKYFTAVLNTEMSTYNDDILKEFKKFMK